MDSFTLVIFGITSNLAQKYMIPALYDMEEKGMLAIDTNIVGIARRQMANEDLHKYIGQVLNMENIHHRHAIKEEVFNRLCDRFEYLSGEIEDQTTYDNLKKELKNKNIIFYLATYPELYSYIFEHLQKNNLSKSRTGWIRLMIEKPIGHDLPSAKALNGLLTGYFTEDQIFRLDHYLGKETLQNILTFRFANDIFEPLINKNFIDHIQITASEDFGIGKRGGYYDQVGALKDVGQNHQLQMLSFATMDAPAKFTSLSIAKEKIKIIKNLQPLPDHIVFGQYEGYQQEENVLPDSSTDTFYALKTFIKNSRFENVPIYIRAGKKLNQTATEISIVFKNPPNRLHVNFGDEPNVLIYRIQPNEGIVFKISTKLPGYETKIKPEYMQYCYRIDPHKHYIPDPYEKLLVDAMRGEHTFFNDAEAVEAQWAFIDPLAARRGKPAQYKAGSWGPKEADRLLEKDGRKWLEPSMDFCRI
ncbi:glucose-6-phosphate dehydrogenase [Candidatus Daviesbacteria bacterium]|nr:glucose-6-phosphate dehydrogenase [Candidatus Daviesbacteria bacterium]